MSERNRRGRREHGQYRGSREFGRRDYGQDQPWREEPRFRYPDEPYRGERERRFGPGYGYGFSDADRYQRTSAERRFEDYRPDDLRRQGRSSTRDRERWEAGRATGGYGSEYGAWRSGANFGFGPEEADEDRGYAFRRYDQGDMNSGRMTGGEFEDTDWIPNRPARGRGVWAGDWGDAPTGPGEYGSQYGRSYVWDRSSGRASGTSRDDYRGRSPKDYRRSDDRIREDICDRLTDDPLLDPSDVTIKVEGGEVILSGFVATRDEKRRAEEEAERVSGVRDVINQIRVNRGEVSGQSMQQSQGRGQRSSSTTQPSSIAADRER
jgi:BON domain